MVSALLAVLVVIIAVLALGWWHLSNELKKGALIPDWNPWQHDLEVVDTQERQVALRLTPRAERENSTRYSDFCPGCGSNPRGFVERPSHLRSCRT